MLDFNTKKQLLKKLSYHADKNFLLFIPCKIAAGFIKLFYFIACHIDIALSDKDGNFLGIKRNRDKTHVKKGKKDDIVYVKKPFFGRLVSAVLCLAFTFTFIPAFDIASFAADIEEDEIIGTSHPHYNAFKLDLATNLYYNSTYSDSNIPSPTIEEYACIQGYGAYKIGWKNNDTYASKIAVSYKGATSTQTPKKEYKTSVTETIIYDLVTTQSYTFYVEAVRELNLYELITVDKDNNPLDPSDYYYEKTSRKYTTYSDPAEYGPATADKLLRAPTFSLEYKSTSDDPSDDSAERATITIDQPDVSGLPEDEIPNGFIIYRSNYDKNPTKYDYVATVAYNPTATSYTHTDTTKLDFTTLYTYKVIAYRDVFNKGAFSKSSKLEDYVPSEFNTVDVLTTTEKPSNFKAKPTETTINLTWSKVARASGYYLYRNTVDDFSTAEQLIRYSENTTSYIDDAADNKTVYYYYLVAYRVVNEGGEEHRSLPAQISASLNTTISNPLGFYGEPDDGKITLSWSCSDSKVAGFELEIKQLTDKNGNPVTDEDGNPIPEDDITPTVIYLDKSPMEYEHIGLHNGETYIYRIRAFKIINGVREPVSDWVSSDKIVVGVRFPAPQDVVVTPSDGEMEIEWSSVKTADGYYLYITKNNSDGTTTEYERKDVSGTSYIHKNLHNGDSFTYYVVAYKEINGAEVISLPSESVTGIVGVELAPPNDISAVPGDGEVTISWTAVKGASWYVIYATGGPAGSTSTISINTQKTTYVHIGLINGEKWTYYVKAFKRVNNEDVSSDPSNSVSAVVGIVLNAPPDIIATPNENEIELSWSSVNGAEGYVLYASDGFNNLTFDVTRTKYTHTDILPGVTWQYYVKAFKTVNGEKVYSAPSATVSAEIGSFIAKPTDFTLTTADASATLKWTKVNGADGYVVTAFKSGGSYEFEVSKNTYTHTGLANGEVWYYYVRAYKIINGEKVYSDPTITLSTKIGAALASPTDLIATAGNRQVDLSWSKVDDADGYVVYLYDEASDNFLPLTLVSKTKYSHTGLKNGKKYTYMVAAYKMLNGERVYGDYSMSVSAIPTSGSASDVDTTLNIKGTAPYGISHSELISAAANHDAFDESVDCYFSVNQESTNAVKEVLRHYANGLKSFIIYPFDISTYLEGTLVSVQPNEGYSITFTMPIPDKLVPYRDYITVVHIDKDGTEIINNDDDYGIFVDATDLQVLPSAVIKINTSWCIQFTTTSCSPFALVIYKDILDDVSSDAFTAAGTFASTFDTGLLFFTSLPDIIPSEKKQKFVVSTKKYYKIKKISRS